MTDENTAKQLYRSKNDRIIGGVCGGLALYFNIDSTLLRILWVVITLFGGAGIIIYLAALIIIPENPEEIFNKQKTENPSGKNTFWGALLIIIGAVLLLKQSGILHHFQFWNLPWQIIWALIFIALGVLLVFNFSLNKNDEPETSQIRKSIFRSRANRKISGVCGGLADYLKIDANIIRLAFILLTIASAGLGILAYILLIIIFPEEPLALQKEEK
ncbi:MAG: PspC domain-containing protein [Calditrichaceae bacterium]|nr:PspC domain-containing protein [Calditrichaceae bacterium]MBN2709918.1 PspC domain-containing protein [Calditrichaceae bacterium]